MGTITLPEPLTEDRQRYYAQTLGDHLADVAEGVNVYDADITYLRRLAERLNCKVLPTLCATDPDGKYFPAVCEGDWGMIVYNATRPLCAQRRIILHELAHHLMVIWVPPALFGVDTVLCLGQDNRHVRHQIARMMAG